MSLTDATITVRIVRSFEYKNHRNLVLSHLDLTKLDRTGLISEIQAALSTRDSLRPIANHKYDTLKLYSQPHGAKTSNPIINVGGDEFMIVTDTVLPLCQLGIGHETEVSYFNWDDYKAYQLNPVSKW